jgi:hypothetical protein
MVFLPPEVLRSMDAEAEMRRTMHRICDLMVRCQSDQFENHADHTFVLLDHRNPKNCSGNLCGIYIGQDSSIVTGNYRSAESCANGLPTIQLTQ